MWYVIAAIAVVVAYFEFQPNIPKHKSPDAEPEPYSLLGSDMPIVFGTCYVKPKILGIELVSKQPINSDSGKK